MVEAHGCLGIGLAGLQRLKKEESPRIHQASIAENLAQPVKKTTDHPIKKSKKNLRRLLKIMFTINL